MALSRRTLIHAALAAAGVAALAGLAAFAEHRTALGPTDGAGFRPIPWPFEADVWPSGRAWRGNDLDVYVRVKPGMCGDCETGVVSDEALDRAVEVDRLDPRFAPAGDGRRVRVTDLYGRARLYSHRMRYRSLRHAEGIAVAYKCDLVVALIDGDMADQARRRMAYRFLESNTVQVWVNRQFEER